MEQSTRGCGKWVYVHVQVQAWMHLRCKCWGGSWISLTSLHLLFWLELKIEGGFQYLAFIEQIKAHRLRKVGTPALVIRSEDYLIWNPAPYIVSAWN